MARLLATFTPSRSTLMTALAAGRRSLPRPNRTMFTRWTLWMAASSGNKTWVRRYPYRISRAATLIPWASLARLLLTLARASLFLDTMTTPDGGTTKKHLIFSLNVDTGAINPGWPVDVNVSATYNGMTFTSSVQGERGALGIVGNILYVPYGGNAG